MRARLASLVAALVLLAPVVVVHASSVRVPADQPTIAAALATAADTVLVSAGFHPEHVVFTNDVVLLSTGGPAHVKSLSSSYEPGLDLRIRGFRVDRQIRLSAENITLEDCWADSTLTCDALSSAQVLDCRAFGASRAVALMTTVSRCRFFGGGLYADGEATSMVSDNYVEGPAAIGIRVGADTYPFRNVVRNCTVGIQATCDVYSGVSDNVVMDCSGTGIETSSCFSAGGVFSRNLVMRCGGDGLRVGGVNVAVQANRVEDVGGTGVWVDATTVDVNDNDVRGAGADGVRVATLVRNFLRNRAIRCEQHGFAIHGNGPIRDNIAGNNQGDGFLVDASGGFHLLLQSNTSYLNGGDAFDVTSEASVPDTVDRLIGYGSQYGLRWTLVGGAGPVRLCNDWFGNSLGTTLGVTPGSTDLTSDPLFCQATVDDVALASGSPALNAPGCGRIGALGLGCVENVGVPPGPIAVLTGLRIDPVPSSGRIRFQWPQAAGGQRLEVLDATGARRWSSTFSGGERETSWDGRDSQGRRLAPGVYFARLSNGEQLFEGRVVIVR